MRLKDYIAQLKERLAPVVQWCQELMPREKNIIIYGSAALVVFFGWLLVDSVMQSFYQQGLSIKSAEQDLKQIALDLETYNTLKKRKTDLEEHYRAVEIKEGVRSLVEKLLREKGKVTDTPSIRDLPAASLGGDYEVVQYSINFSINSMKDLSSFLYELVYGAKPVIITQLDVKKNVRTGDRVDVLVNISSIRLKEA